MPGIPSQYTQPFFDSLSQGVQVAQSLRQAALQQQQLQQAHDEFQQQQQLKQQEFAANQQQSLAAALSNGAKPVDASGNVNVAAPVAQSTLTPSPAASPFAPQPGGAAPLPTGASSMTPSLNFGTGATANVAADPGRGSVSIGGQKLQVQTPADKFQEQLGQQGQLEKQHNQIALDQAKQIRDLTWQPLPDTVTGPLNMAPGQKVPPEKYTDYANAATNAKKEADERQVQETAATLVAKKNGITLVPGKSAYDQLPPELQLQATTKAAMAKENPALIQNTLATGESNRQSAAMVRQNAETAQADRETASLTRSYQTGQTAVQAQMERITEAQQMLNSGNAETQTLAVPKVLTALLSGQGSGIRITQAELNSIAKARGIAGNVYGWIQKAGSGKSLTPDQNTQLQGILQDVGRRLNQKMQVASHTIDQIQNAPDRAGRIAADQTGRKNLNSMESGGSQEVGSQQEYDALPSGTVYTSNGTLFRKP